MLDENLKWHLITNCQKSRYLRMSCRFYPIGTIYLFKINFIVIQSLYNVMLVSTIQQNESAIHIHISPCFKISFPFRSLQKIEQNSLCCTTGSQQLSILYTVGYIRQSQSPSSSPTFPFGIHMFVLYINVSALQISSHVPFFQIIQYFILLPW